MIIGSCFSGQGLADLGFYLAGWEIAWQIEKEEYARKILTLRWPEVPKHGDIKEAKDMPAVDAILGGFPCQPFSTAGDMRGSEDDRYLWPEMRWVISEVKPRWVIAENVPGIIGIALDDVLHDLESLAYEAVTIIFPAHALGAPHRRDRLWIVAYFDGQRCQERRRAITIPAALTGIKHGGEIMADPFGLGGNGRLPRPGKASTGGAYPEAAGRGWWESEPAVRRVVNGCAHRVDRLRGLGNGVVVQVAYFIGRKIIELEEELLK